MPDDQQFKHNLSIPVGATYRHLFVYTRSSAEAPTVFTPVDLTGCTAALQVRDTLTSSVARVTLTSEVGGGITLGGTSGSILLDFSPANTSLLARGGEYDILLTFPDGTKEYAFGGTVNAIVRATRV